MVQLAPLTGKWSTRRVPTNLPILMGNEGSVSALDASRGALWVVLAASTTSQDYHLAQIDVATGTVANEPPPPLGKVGLGLLLNLVFKNET